MKSCIKYLSVLLIFVGPSIANAQLDFAGGGGGRLPVLFSQSGYSRDIINNGASDSPAYTIRVWAATNRALLRSDQPIATDNYGPLGAGQTVRRGYRHSTPIDSDTRALKDIIGERYFFEMCIEVVAVAPVCRIDSREVRAPDASQPDASLGTSTQGTLIEYSTVTRNSEIPFDFLLVGWRDRALDGGPTQPEVFTEFNAADLVILENGQTSKRFQVLFESTPGVPGLFSVSQCFNLAGAPDGRSCSTPITVSTDVGYRRAIASATQGERSDLIRVEWPRFTLAEGFDAYRVTRCLENNSNSCVTDFVASRGPLERFDDTSAQRGERYIYTIDSCVGRGITNCDPSIYPNVAESESAFIGLVDAFEEDGSPAQATIISRTAEQLHSYHNETDEDWVRIDLSKASRLVIETSIVNSENVDTVLSLFDESENLLLENDDSNPVNNVAGFSKIETELLPAGSYFIKSAHFRLPIDGFPAPTANNYLLRIKVVDTKVDMTPIIMLLLQDE